MIAVVFSATFSQLINEAESDSCVNRATARDFCGGWSLGGRRQHPRPGWEKMLLACKNCTEMPDVGQKLLQTRSGLVTAEFPILSSVAPSRPQRIHKHRQTFQNSNSEL